MESLRYYLASASPRRLEIMEKLRIKVEVLVSNADENVETNDPVLMVQKLSYRKAKSVYDSLDKDEKGIVVIGADTVVSLDGHILGKPSDEEEAYNMLRSMSGRRHSVYTGVTVFFKDTDGMETSVTFHEETGVDFCDMSDTEINDYISTGDPMDKAGGYGVQSYAAPFISAINGDYYNVMGLPACRLYHELQKLGALRYV